jgi:WD40 repeat protein
MTFDPYHKWLGILPEEQPPNHYRLLGIVDFESDEEIIEGAASQRTLYLRTLASGKHEEAAAKLLNEVAAARVALLSQETREEYNRTLKASPTISDSDSTESILYTPPALARNTPPPLPSTQVQPHSSSMMYHQNEVQESVFVQSRFRGKRSRYEIKTRSNLWLIISVVGVSTLLITLVLLSNWDRVDSDQPSRNATDVNKNTIAANNLDTNTDADASLAGGVSSSFAEEGTRDESNRSTPDNSTVGDVSNSSELQSGVDVKPMPESIEEAVSDTGFDDPSMVKDKPAELTNPDGNLSAPLIKQTVLRPVKGKYSYRGSVPVERTEGAMVVDVNAKNIAAVGFLDGSVVVTQIGLDPLETMNAFESEIKGRGRIKSIDFDKSGTKLLVCFGDGLSVFRVLMENGQLVGIEHLRSRLDTKIILNSANWISVNNDVGRYVIAGANNGMLRVWDSSTDAILQETDSVHGKAIGVTALCYDPVSDSVYSSGRDGKLVRWENRSSFNKPIDLHGSHTGNDGTDHSGPIVNIAYSSQSSRAVAAARRQLKVWRKDKQDDELQQEFVLSDFEGTVLDCDISTDGEFVIGAGNRNPKIWNLSEEPPKGVELLPEGINLDNCRKVRFSSDGRTIAALTSDNVIHIWIQDEEEVLLADLTELPPDNSASSTEPEQMQDKPVRLSIGPLTEIIRQRLSSAVPAAQGADVIWNKAAKGNFICMSPDGALVAKSDDIGIELFHIGASKFDSWYRHELQINPVRVFDFLVSKTSSDKKSYRLISNGDNNAVVLWDIVFKENLYQLENPVALKGHSFPVCSAAVSPDSKTLVSGDLAGNIIVWNLISLRQVAKVHAHDGLVMSLDISSDGRWIASGSEDKTTKVWDYRKANSGVLAAPAEVLDFSSSVWCARFSPDSEVLAVGGMDKPICVWNTAGFEEIGRLGASRPTWHLEFSPNGLRLMAARSSDFEVFNTYTGELLTKVRGHVNYTRAISVLPNGNQLVSTGDGGVGLKLWTLDFSTYDSLFDDWLRSLE